MEKYDPFCQLHWTVIQTEWDLRDRAEKCYKILNWDRLLKFIFHMQSLQTRWKDLFTYDYTQVVHVSSFVRVISKLMEWALHHSLKETLVYSHHLHGRHSRERCKGQTYFYPAVSKSRKHYILNVKSMQVSWSALQFYAYKFHMN